MINKDEIKRELKRILIYYGAKPNENGNWDCIASRHGNHKNNLSIKGNICCCHCGLQGDSFNIIAEMEGFDCKSDFSLIAKKAAEILNLPMQNYQRKKKEDNFDRQIHNPDITQSNIDLTKIITENFKKAKRGNYEYFYKRGFNNLDIFRKHKILISNPRKIFPVEIVPQLNNIWAYEYIIPIWKNRKVVNCILRRNDLKSKKNNKTMNLKGLKVEFLNSDYLQGNNIEHLFICEGWADALSFETLGYKSISINTITMINRFISEIKENINNFKKTIFFICFDNDEKQWGQKYAKKLVVQLKENKLKAFNLNIKKQYKDINEYFVNDLNLFKKSIEYLIMKI